MKYFTKEAGFTQHGKIREEGKAMAYKGMADAAREASSEYPGMDYMKGTYLDSAIGTLFARKQAYKASLEGVANLKGLVPFVGMGPAGKKALADLEKAIKEGK